MKEWQMAQPYRMKTSVIALQEIGGNYPKLYEIDANPAHRIYSE